VDEIPKGFKAGKLRIDVEAASFSFYVQLFDLRLSTFELFDSSTSFRIKFPKAMSQAVKRRLKSGRSKRPVPCFLRFLNSLTLHFLREVP